MTNGKLDEIRTFAKETNQTEQFEEVLKRLTRHEEPNVGNGMQNTSEVVLYSDFAPYSLYFVWQTDKGSCIMNGGVIYHGKHDNGGSGGAPTFSVNLSSKNGWSIHT